MIQQQQQQEIDHAVPIGQHIIRRTRHTYLSYPIRYCIHAVTHGKAIATVTATTEREKEGIVVLVSFVWCSLDNTLFIALDLQY